MLWNRARPYRNKFENKMAFFCVLLRFHNKIKVNPIGVDQYYVTQCVFAQFKEQLPYFKALLEHLIVSVLWKFAKSTYHT